MELEVILIIAGIKVIVNLITVYSSWPNHSMKSSKFLMSCEVRYSSNHRRLMTMHMCLLVSDQEGQIDALFQKIDWSSMGAITWDEFCTYMQLEYAEKEDSYLRAKEVAFQLPAKVDNMPHREPVLRMMDTADGMFVACSQDGMVTFWSGQLEHKRTRTVVVIHI